MKKKGINPMMIGAVVLGVAAIVLFWMYTSQLQQEADLRRKADLDRLRKEFEQNRQTGSEVVVERVESRPVVYATQNVVANQPIDRVFIEIKQTPNELLPGAYEDIEEVVGKFARRDINSGEPLSPDNVANEFQKMSNRLMPGMRAIALPVIMQNDATGGFATDGDYVDLILTYFNPPGQETNFSVLTVMQNVKVLYVPGNVPRTEQTTGLAPTPPPGGVPVTTTFEVTPEQADYLISLSQIGTLRMVLRHKDDDIIHRSRSMENLEFYNNPFVIQQRVKRSIRKTKEIADEIQRKRQVQQGEPNSNEPAIIQP